MSKGFPQFCLCGGLLSSEQVVHLNKASDIGSRCTQLRPSLDEFVLKQGALVLVHFQGRRASELLAGVLIDWHGMETLKLYVHTAIDV